MIEIIPAPERNYLKAFGEQIMRLLGIDLQMRTAPGYWTYGKYRVKETFAGEESLTSLLTQYVSSSNEMIFIYSFETYEKAYEMYRELEGRSNIGAYHGMDRDNGKFLVKIEFQNI